MVVILGFTHRTFCSAVYFAVCKLFIGRKTFYKSIDLKYQTFNPGLLFFYIRAYVSRPDCSSRLQSEKLKASSFPVPVPSPTLEWTKGLRCHSSLFSLDHPQSPAGSYCFCPHLAFSMSFWGSRSKTHPGSWTKFEYAPAPGGVDIFCGVWRLSVRGNEYPQHSSAASNSSNEGQPLSGTPKGLQPGPRLPRPLR